MLNITEEQAQYLEQKEAFLDKFIDEDDEYKLFISSYIHGHFSLVVANMPEDIHGLEPFIQTFRQALYQAVDVAISHQELAATDAEAVMKMLDDLFA